MDDLTPRLRAVCDLDVAKSREQSGRHEYDGVIQDLSRNGVQAALSKLGGDGDRLDDTHDEAHLDAFEAAARTYFGDLQLHRSNPLPHLDGLDLACYDRNYASQEQREAARLAHLAQWPQAVDTAIETLDQLSAPVAEALGDAIRGLAAGIPATADESVREQAVAAHARLVAHIDQAAAGGPADAALGTAGLTALMSTAETIPVDIGRLSERADAERDRLTARLAQSCAHIDPDRPPLEVARELVRDHPDADGVIEAAQHWTELAIAFTKDHDLVPYHDGECLVGLAPPSRRWGMAMMSWAAPGEPEGPSWYHITPPEDSWTRPEQEEWLEVFSATTLPGITAHEVAPGHFSHGRALRRAPPRSAACCNQTRSGRAGRTTPRNSALRRGCSPTIPGSRSASGLRRWSGSPGWPARSVCTPLA
jgi:hypothetical protein